MIDNSAAKTERVSLRQDAPAKYLETAPPFLRKERQMPFDLDAQDPEIRSHIIRIESENARLRERLEKIVERLPEIAENYRLPPTDRRVDRECAHECGRAIAAHQRHAIREAALKGMKD